MKHQFFARTMAAAVAAAAACGARAGTDALAEVAATAGVAVGLSAEEEKTPDVWTGKVGAGFDAQSGNTDKSGITAGAEAKKLEGAYVVVASAEGGWEETRVVDSDGSERDERTLGYAKAAVNAKRRFEGLGFFVYGDFSARNDDVSGVRYRLSESLGLGTYLLDEEGMKLSVEAGVAQVQEKLAGTPSDSYTALRLAERGDYIPAWGKKISLFEYAEWLCDADDSDHWFAKVEAGIDIPMVSSLNLALKVTLDHENMPAEGKDKTDRRFTAQVGWAF